MKGNVPASKRFLAMLLAVVTVLSGSVNCFAVAIDTEVPAGNKQTVTVGELVADAYSAKLTAAEQAVLKSGYLTGGSITYTAPSEGDDLIAVDEAAKTITIKSATKDGYTWEPVGARIVPEDGSAAETVALTKGSSGYTGSFSYAGNTYSVEADYTATVEIDGATQSLLLNAPYMLAKGLQNIETLDHESGAADLLEQYFDALYDFRVNGAQVKFGENPMTLRVTEGSATANAIDSLKAQIDKNGGSLDINVELGKYSTGKMKYLLNDGSVMKEVAAQYYNDISTLSNKDTGTLYGVASTVINLSGSGAMIDETTLAKAKTIQKATEYLGTVSTKIKPAVEDEWLILNQTVARTDLADADYSELETLAFAANGQSSLHNSDITVEKAVRTLKTTVSANVNRFNVTVKYEAKVITAETVDSDVLTTLNYSSEWKVTLRSGTTKAEVEAAIAAKVNEAEVLETWKAFDVGTAYYNRTVTDFGETLTGDVTYVVSYTPKNVSYSLGDGNGVHTVPYGYRVTLPVCETEGQSYQYKLGEDTYDEGIVYRVVGDTVFTREMDKTRTGYGLGQLTAKAAAGLTTEEKNVLNSAVLTPNDTIVRVRVPENSDKLVSLTLNTSGTTTVTAKEYSAKYARLSWKPVTAKAILNGSTAATASFTGETATLGTTSFDSVQVEYVLTFGDEPMTGSEVLAMMNLPQTLLTEAKSHEAAMKKFTDVEDQLKTLNKTNMKLVRTMMEGDEQDGTPDKLGADAMLAIDNVINNCYNGDNLKLYNYVTEYAAGTELNGLAYLYQNKQYKTIRAEAEKLRGYLMTISADPNFKNALSSIEVDGKNGADYADKIDDAIRKINEAVDALPTEINSAIRTNGAAADMIQFISAVKALEGHTGNYTAAPVLKLTVDLTAAAPNMVVVTVKVTADGITKTGTKTYEKNHELTVADIIDLNTLRDNLWKALKADTDAAAKNISDDFYAMANGLTLTAGTVLGTLKVEEVTYEAKNFTVHIDGESDQTFTIKNPSITLKAPEAGYRYDYVVDNAKVSVQGTDSSFHFSAEQVKRLFVGGELTITRTKVNVQEESMRAFFKGLNAKLNSDQMDFIALEKEGKVSSVVVRLSINSSFDPKLISSIGNYLIDADCKVNEIKLAGSNFFVDGKVYPSGMINMLSASGISIESIQSALNPDGTINEMTLDGETVIVDSNVNKSNLLGGKLVQSTITLGTEDGETTVPLYITMESNGTDPAKLKKAYDNIEKAQKHVDAAFNGDGTLVMNGTLPDRAYQAALTMMLALGKTELSDVTNIETAELVDYALDMARPLFADERVTLTTVDNTAKQLGETTDLAQYNSTYRSLRGYINYLLGDKVEITEKQSNGGTYSAKIATYSKDALDAFNIDADVKQTIRDILAPGDKLELNISMTLNNVENNDYEAIVMDPNAKGAGKLVYTKDLSESLKTTGAKTVVILLKNVPDSLTVNARTFLDLNGKTIEGGITANDTVTVLDGTLNNTGKVNGTVSGSAVLAAGTYTGDVSGMLKQGYVVENGKVVNEFYTLAEDENGNITVTLKAEALQAKKPAVKTLALDLADDLLMNFYTTAGMKVKYDGAEYNIYTVNEDDLVKAYKENKNALKAYLVNELVDIDWSTTGIEGLVNKLLADMSDFTALSGKISNGTVAKMDLLTGDWHPTISYNAEGDYIQMNIAPEATYVTRTLTIKVGGDAEAKKNLADASKEMGEIATVNDASVSGLNVTYADKLKVDGKANLDVSMDMSEKPEYIAVMASVLAYGTTGETQTKFVEALKTYTETKQTKPIKEAIDALTTADAVAALKKANVDFDKVLELLAGKGVDTTKLGNEITLENTYHAILTLLYRALGYADITGSSKKIGAYETGEYGVYDLSKTYKSRVTMHLNLKLVGENEVPTLSDPTVTKDGTIVKGAKVDTENKYIILDTCPDGITEAQFRAIISYQPQNATAEDVVLTFSKTNTYKNAERICNGCVVTAKAVTDNGTSEEVVYTVIILGDVSGDGIVMVNDIVLIVKSLQVDEQQKVPLEEGAQTMAADASQDGKIMVNDAVRIAQKINNWIDGKWGEYSSMVR